MKKIAKDREGESIVNAGAGLTAVGMIIVLGITAVVMAIYSLYQQSQLYPAVHQQIGYQKCVTEVNAQVAAQQAAQQPQPEVTTNPK